jgi:hypothetical protein
MSLEMAAILGYLLDRQYTTPALAEISVTAGGGVLVRAQGVPRSVFRGAEADLRANFLSLGIAPGLAPEEWAEHLAVAYAKLGIILEDPRPETRDPRPETRDPRPD